MMRVVDLFLFLLLVHGSKYSVLWKSFYGSSHSEVEVSPSVLVAHRWPKHREYGGLMGNVNYYWIMNADWNYEHHENYGWVVDINNNWNILGITVWFYYFFFFIMFFFLLYKKNTLLMPNLIRDNGFIIG